MNGFWPNRVQRYDNHRAEQGLEPQLRHDGFAKQISRLAMRRDVKGCYAMPCYAMLCDEMPCVCVHGGDFFKAKREKVRVQHGTN